MRWTDSTGQQRVAAYGLALPIPDAVRPFNAIVEGIMNRNRDDRRSLTDMVGGSLDGVLGSLVDYAGPSFNPVADVIGVGASVAMGGNPNRGLNPFSNQKVMPMGSGATSDDRRKVLLDYFFQRLGLSQMLPKMSGDMPNSSLPGFVRTHLFVDEAGLAEKSYASKLEENRRKRELDNQIDYALKTGGMPPWEATAEQIRRREEGRSASSWVRGAQSLGKPGAADLGGRLRSAAARSAAEDALRRAAVGDFYSGRTGF
jgi:hypothetical protein